MIVELNVTKLPKDRVIESLRHMVSHYSNANTTLINLKSDFASDPFDDFADALEISPSNLLHILDRAFGVNSTKIDAYRIIRHEPNIDTIAIRLSNGSFVDKYPIAVNQELPDFKNFIVFIKSELNETPDFVKQVDENTPMKTIFKSCPELQLRLFLRWPAINPFFNPSDQEHHYLLYWIIRLSLILIPAGLWAFSFISLVQMLLLWILTTPLLIYLWQRFQNYRAQYKGNLKGYWETLCKSSVAISQD